MAKKAIDATENTVEIMQEETMPEPAVAVAATSEIASESSGCSENSQTERDGAVESHTENNASGFCCYIGPNLKNLIQTGAVYRGTLSEAFTKAADAISAQPLVKTLIVTGEQLPEARVKVKTPGNILYANYQKLAGKE